jgi:glycosyltransferase involved in cell wall biosynthesis
MRVAIVHYWLVGMRGGERVLEELIRLYPQADIFTHVVDRERISELILSRPITESFVGKLPGAKKHYQKYLGFMPRALEELDLSGYDLVISSESGPAKGVIVAPGALHICYTHSPMRYIWDHFSIYRSRMGWLAGTYFSHLAHRLRIWDVTTSARVDQFVANSSFIAQRIKRYYNRDAQIVHPPVDLEAYRLPESEGTRDYYLFVSELVPYKRADIVIDAFHKLDLKLIVVGDGSERRALSKDLPDNIRLLGRVPFEDLPGLYQGAKALVFPAEEDFGIVPVEAMACGTPVLAYGRGGALDSVIADRTGYFFDQQSVEAVRAAVAHFEVVGHQLDHGEIAQHAKSFSAERFRDEFKIIVDDALAQQLSRPNQIAR